MISVIYGAAPIISNTPVVSYLLELACRSQNIMNIELGRSGLLALPRQWLLGRFYKDAEPLLRQEAEWEYRRLLEVARQLDRDLFQRFVSGGLHSEDAQLREVAEEWLEEGDEPGLL
jgi:hypothetical protein